MSGWMILALVLLGLYLLGRLKIGAEARYGPEELAVRLRLGPFRLKLYPSGEDKPKKAPKEPKPKKQKKRPKSEKPEKAPKEKQKLDVLALVKAFVPLALEAAGCFWHKLVVDKLELCLTVGGTAPADAAMLYGQANAALGAIWQPLNRAFHVKEGRAHIQVDFDAPETTLSGEAALSLRLGQILWLGLHFGVKALRRFLQYRKEQKRKRSAQKRKAV